MFDKCIYIHINKTNGKVYIGQTVSPKKRWGLTGNQYKRSNPHFYRAIQKYGWVGFLHVIYRTGLSTSEANIIEQQLILSYKSTDDRYGYNITIGGEGCPYGKNCYSHEYRYNYQKEYYDKNKVELNKKRREYRRKNLEKFRQMENNYLNEHREAKRLANKRNREKYLEKRKAYLKDYYQKHKEKIKQQVKINKQHHNGTYK